MAGAMRSLMLTRGLWLERNSHGLSSGLRTVRKGHLVFGNFFYGCQVFSVKYISIRSWLKHCCGQDE